MITPAHAENTEETKSLPRVTARLSKDEHELVEKAAKITGYGSVNSFMRTNILEISRAIILRHEHIALSERAAQALADAMDRPARDLPKLKRLFGN